MPPNKFNQLDFPSMWEQIALSWVEHWVLLASKGPYCLKHTKSKKKKKNILNPHRLTEGEVDGKGHWWKNCISTSCTSLVGLQEESPSLFTPLSFYHPLLPTLLPFLSLSLLLFVLIVDNLHKINTLRMRNFSRGSSGPGTEPRSIELQIDSLLSELPGKPQNERLLYFKYF